MSSYQALDNAYSSKLGSFEGHGASSTFGNQLGNFGESYADAHLMCKTWQKLERGLDMDGNRLDPQPSSAEKRESGLKARKACFRATQLKDDRPLVARDAEGNVIPPGRKAGKYSEAAYKERASGASAGEILGGIGAILAPLAQMGVGMYGAQLQGKTARDAARMAAFRKKSEDSGYDSGGYSMPEEPKSNTGLIVVAAIALGALLLGGVYMMKGGQQPAQYYGPSRPPATTFAGTYQS